MQCTGFTGDCFPRSMFPSVDDRPKMLDIIAGTDKKDITALFSGSCMCKGGFAGDSAPCAVFLALSSGPKFAASWPVWTRGTVVSVLGWFTSCLDKVVHTPVVCNDRCLWFRLQKTVESPQLQSFLVGDISCRGADVDAHGPVLKTIEILQLQCTDKVVDVCFAGPVVLGFSRGGDSRAPTVAAR